MLPTIVLPNFQRPVRMEFLDAAGVKDVLPLLELEHREFEAVLGQPVELVRADVAVDHVWRVVVDPHVPSAQLRADPDCYRLTSVIPKLGDIGLSLNLLHALAHSDQHTLSYTELTSYDEVVQRVRDMVGNVYPYFELRGLDWEQLSAQYEHLAQSSSDEFWQQLHRWVAELGDAHTAIIPPGKAFHPPYIAEMTEHGARLRQVPEFSAANQAGVRAGWVIDVEDPHHWLSTTGASPQHHRLVTARRFMQTRTPRRRFTATSPGGVQAAWDETPEPPLPSVTARGSDLRISRFDVETPSLLAQILGEGLADSGVSIDLRGNVGGSLVAADQCRRMLIRRAGEYGHAQYSDGRGGLSEKFPLWLEPIATGFTGDVRILVDSLTYSAAEDFLQPLADLEHVTVEGGPTGGGSGRPTTVPLMDGYSLRVSTTLTYTRAGDPIEHFGILGST